MSKTVVIEIKDGVLHADAEGFQGNACLNLLDQLLPNMATKDVVKKKEAQMQTVSMGRIKS